jgi:hypothetical protein
LNALNPLRASRSARLGLHLHFALARNDRNRLLVFNHDGFCLLAGDDDALFAHRVTSGDTV